MEDYEGRASDDKAPCPVRQGARRARLRSGKGRECGQEPRKGLETTRRVSPGVAGLLRARRALDGYEVAYA